MRRKKSAVLSVSGPAISVLLSSTGPVFGTPCKKCSDPLNADFGAETKITKFTMRDIWQAQQMAQAAGLTSTKMVVVADAVMDKCDTVDGLEDKLIDEAMFKTLVDWVERDIEPGEISGSLKAKGRIVRTRPMCPYPNVAEYKGTGSIDDAENFTCLETK